jgi:hypothetical protein
MEEAGGRPPVAQAVPPQPVPIEPHAERAALENVGCGVIVAVIAVVLLIVALMTTWW